LPVHRKAMQHRTGFAPQAIQGEQSATRSYFKTM
jgi:hypothetical protein